MKIKDRLDFSAKPTPITLRPKDSVRKALDIMCEKNIGSVIITSKDMSVKGIVTERDMMVRVLKKGLNPDKTKISAIMSTKIRLAKENDDLVDWLKIMSHERFRRLPIVDKDGKLINMLSQGDFVAFTHPDLDEKIRADLNGRLGKGLQILLILSAIITLSFIAFKL